MKTVKALIVSMIVAAPLSGDSWVQATKSQFKTGNMDGVQATLPPGEDDGYLRLAIPVFNGYFDETDNGMDGWSDESIGDGTHTVEIVDGGGRTSVAHLYASYGTEATSARIGYTITDGLDFLQRFNFELYPISSEISYDGRMVLVVSAYDSEGNSLITGDWMIYLIDGSSTINTYNWRAQTVRDRWNTYRFDLKSDIEQHLAVGHQWADVAEVHIVFSAEAPNGSDSYGAYIDAVWAASFIDDNFDDSSVDTTKWALYEHLYHVAETDSMVRFWGYDDTTSTENWSSFDREGDTVGNAPCEAAAKVRHLFMENEEGQEFELGFYSPTSGRYLILRAHRTGGNSGFYYVSYYDGTSWNSSQIGTYYFLAMSNFYTWRIIYDADNQRFEAWVDGKMAGRVENFAMENYYPYLAVTNSPIEAGDSIDCQIDYFMFFDYADGEHNKRYVSSGEYTSQPYDLGFAADFLKFKWAAETPPGTDVKFQFRSGWTLDELENAQWRGPDGPNSYFTVSGQQFDSFHDGHRWFQVKAILTSSDSTATPTVDSIIVEFDSMAVVEADSDVVHLTGTSSVVQYDALGDRVLTAHFDDLSGGSAGSPIFTVAVHREPHPRLSGGINRWWRLDMDGDFSSADITFHYLDSDIPNGIDEASMVAWRYEGNWTSFPPNALNTGDNSFRLNGLTQLSEWTLGEAGATQVGETSGEMGKNPMEMRFIISGNELAAVITATKRVPCNFSVFDVAGRTVIQPFKVEVPMGTHRVELGRLPHSGVFFVRVRAGETALSRKLIAITDRR